MSGRLPRSHIVCAHGARPRAAHISTLEASVGRNFKYSGSRAITCRSSNMAANDSGCSALDAHGQPPRLPPPIIAMASDSMAENARAFGEAPSLPVVSDQVGVNNAPSSGGGVGGAAAAAQHASGVPEQGARKRRVVVCKNCGAEGHMVKTCGRPAAGVLVTFYQWLF